MSRIMILGGGPNQFPFVLAAKKQGFEVIVADYNDQAVAVKEADHFINVSIFDEDAIFRAAKDMSVDGIFTSSEPGMLVVTKVAKELSLPAPSLECYLTMSRKDKMKRFLITHDFHVPRHHILDSKEEVLDRPTVDRIGFPMIVKPVDASGSRGVQIVHDRVMLDEAVSFAFEYSKVGQILLEQYLINRYDFMVGGDIFVYGGEIIHFGIMRSLRDRRLNDLSPVGTCTPPLLSDADEKAVRQLLKRAIDNLGFKNGPINIEVMIAEDGNPYIIELNPRNGGNSIPELLNDATRFDGYLASILVSLGRGKEIVVPKVHPRYMMTYVVHAHATGKLHSVDVGKLQPYVYKRHVFKKPGDKVRKFHHAEDKIETLFLEFPSLSIMEAALTDIHQEVHAELYEIEE